MYTEEKNGRTGVSVILTVETFEPQKLRKSIESVFMQKGQGKKGYTVESVDVEKRRPENGESEENQKEFFFFLEQLVLLDLTQESACVDWLEENYGKEERLLVLKPEERISRGRGLNWGVEAATGEYLAFLHSGTQWQEEKLRKQLAYLEKKNSLWIYGVAAIAGRGKVHYPNPSLPLYQKAGYLFHDLIREMTVKLDTVVMRRQDYLELGGGYG